MDIREYLQKEQKGFYRIITENLTLARSKQLYDAINHWHKSELKLLGIGVVVRSVFTIHSTEDESIIKIVGTEEEAKQEVLKFAEEHEYADFFYEKQTL